MRAMHFLAFLLLPAACAAPATSGVAQKPAPFGTPCTRQCLVRLVNNTTQTLALHAATADGSRVVGTVEAGKERAFAEWTLAPSYNAVPAATPSAHGVAAAGTAAPVSCATQSPRPSEDLMLVCK